MKAKNPPTKDFRRAFLRLFPLRGTSILRRGEPAKAFNFSIQTEERMVRDGRLPERETFNLNMSGYSLDRAEEWDRYWSAIEDSEAA